MSKKIAVFLQQLIKRIKKGNLLRFFQNGIVKYILAILIILKPVWFGGLMTLLAVFNWFVYQPKEMEQKKESIRLLKFVAILLILALIIRFAIVIVVWLAFLFFPDTITIVPIL